jgi:SAM-dependent methyltransferase
VPNPSVVRRDKGLVRHTLHQTLHVDAVRHAVALARFVWFARVRRRLRTLESAEGIAAHTVGHNLVGLRDLAVNRSLFLVRPLSTIERLGTDAELLVVGPRTEGELLALLAHGFQRETIRAVDLISYSPWVDLGDLHALPYADSSFDAVTLGWVLAYSDDRPRAVREIVRVCRPGAVVAIGVEWNPLSTGEIEDRCGYVPGSLDRISSTEEIVALFDGNVGEVLVREDIPVTRRAEVGALVVLFTIQK